MAKIGVYDSGCGGLSVLKEILRALPGEEYLYFADNAYCPYGDKDQSFILDRAREITDWMLWKGADIIVVACNTATAAAIADLREEYGDPSERVKTLTRGRIDHIKFIGMEPAVKPAALGTKSGVIGVLATAGTLAGSKYLTAKEKWEDGIKIVEHVGEGFVELVESGELEGEHALQTVRASVQPLLDEGADTIVLGCTHYPFLKGLIAEVAGPQVRIIDPAPAVARQLVNVMKEEGIEPAQDPAGPHVSLNATGSKETLERLSKADILPSAPGNLPHPSSSKP